MIGRASAPASSGNLGPGFDVLALALELRCRVTAEPAAEMVIVQDGVTVAVGDDDMVAAAALAAAGRPMRLAIENDIPRARGLGSSSAVTAAAATAAARALGREPEPAEVFRIVAGLEGHGDNAAAAVYGGLVAVCGAAVRRLELHPGILPVVAVPDFELRTGEARSALPSLVPLTSAAAGIARSVFLVEGLRSGDPAVLCEARGDELHEAPRAALSPLTARLVTAALDAGALHAAWSGAGPSAIAFVTGETSRAVTEALRRVLGPVGEVRTVAVDRAGVR